MLSEKVGERLGDMRKIVLCKAPCNTKHKLGQGLYVDEVIT